MKDGPSAPNDATQVAEGLVALTRWSAALTWDNVPDVIKARAALVLSDDIAAMVAARDEPELIQFQEGMAASSGSAEATVFNGRGQRLDRYSAAVANGGASDWCELDEGYRKALCHAGIYCVPALLAEAEATNASARDLLRALVVGYETSARIARCFTFPNLTLHPHGSLAAVGAAASVAALRGLSAMDAAAAISSAATMVVPGPYNHAVQGALVRNVWPGVGAWSGLRAVDWLAAGIGGRPESLHDVYGAAFGGTVAAAELSADLGEAYALADGYHKLFACCQYSHAAVEATLALRANMPGDIGVGDLSRIHIDTHWRGQTLDNVQPATTLAAKFSMQHVLAASAIFGHGGAEAFHASTLRDPAISSLREKVTIGAYEPELAPPNDRPARVRWEFADGTSLEQEVLSARGGPDLPFAAEEIRDKIRDIVGDCYPAMPDALGSLQALDADTMARPWSQVVAAMTAQ